MKGNTVCTALVPNATPTQVAGKNRNHMLPAMFIALAICAVGMTAANAGTDATFSTIYTTVSGWATGSLGKLFAVAAFIIGMGIGLVKQSAMAVVLGIAFALIMAYGPGIIDQIVTFAV